jgi:hypothetical protein
VSPVARSRCRALRGLRSSSDTQDRMSLDNCGRLKRGRGDRTVPGKCRAHRLVAQPWTTQPGRPKSTQSRTSVHNEVRVVQA